MLRRPKEAFREAGKKQKIPDMLNPSHFGMTGKSSIKYHRNERYKMLRRPKEAFRAAANPKNDTLTNSP
ncbi:MAG: hypothetical protein AAFN10_17225 [Bacteroidota bacterium]